MNKYPASRTTRTNLQQDAMALIDPEIFVWPCVFCTAARGDSTREDTTTEAPHVCSQIRIGVKAVMLEHAAHGLRDELQSKRGPNMVLLEPQVHRR